MSQNTQNTEYEFDIPDPAPELPAAHIAWTLDGREVVTHGAPGISAEALAAAVGATDWQEVEAGYAPPLSADELEAQFSAAVTARLDAFALERQYDDIASARLAVLSSEYAADGQAANAAYDATWTAAITLVPQVRSGDLTPEQAVEQLPALAWPGD